jgi:hypothetical protein
MISLFSPQLTLKLQSFSLLETAFFSFFPFKPNSENHHYTAVLRPPLRWTVRVVRIVMQYVIYFTFVSVKLKSIEQECLFLFIIVASTLPSLRIVMRG